MFRNFFLALVMLFMAFSMYAIPTKIEGRIKGAGNTKEIYLYPDKAFGSFEKQVIPLFQQGIFAIEIDLPYPQMGVIGVDGKYLKVYLSPGANIVLDADAMIFPQGVNYAGAGGPDNYLLQAFYEIDPPIREFDKQYFRIFGHQFPFSTQIAGYMGLYHPEDYRNRLNKKYGRMKGLFTDVQFEKATPDFQRFLRSEIEGFLQYNLLGYVLLHAKREKIDLNYFNLEHLEVGDVNSDYYRNYLILNNLYTASLSDGNNPRAQTCYRLAQSMEQDIPLQYLLSEIIVNAVRKGDEETLLLFEEYLNDYPHAPFSKKIDKVIFKDQARFFGEMAPDFALQTESSEGFVTLSQFKGKVVYIDFWASWCKPCLDKLDKLEREKRKNNSDDIVFITISIDASKQVWKNTLKNRGYSGVHLYAGKNSAVAKDFKVKGVPSEFIIKKNGQFAPTPEDSDPASLILLLKRFNNK